MVFFRIPLLNKNHTNYLVDCLGWKDIENTSIDRNALCSPQCLTHMVGLGNVCGLFGCLVTANVIN